MEKYIKTIKEWKPIVMTQAELLQKELHEFALELAEKNPKIEYQDAVVTYLLLQIADLQINIRKLWASEPPLYEEPNFK